jgi:hypothetical protein
VLSFVNDLFSRDSINLELYRPNPGDSVGGRRYTFFSLGLMIGIIAACLHIGVAAIAAANAALTCRLSNLTPPNRKEMVPDLGLRAMYCMALLFVAFNLSGASLVSLCVGYDVAFTITVAMVYFSGLIVAAFQLINHFMENMDWFFGWHERLDPIRFISCIFLGPLLALTVLWPSPSSWPPFVLSCFTLMHHMFASLTSRLTPKRDDEANPDNETQPDDEGNAAAATPKVVRRRFRKNEGRLAGCAAGLAFAWAGCAALAATWGLHEHPDEKVLQLAIAALAACQMVIVGGIAGMGWCNTRRLPKDLRTSNT